jgi:hypothetical protein
MMAAKQALKNKAHSRLRKAGNCISSLIYFLHNVGSVSNNSRIFWAWFPQIVVPTDNVHRDIWELKSSVDNRDLFTQIAVDADGAKTATAPNPTQNTKSIGDGDFE